jgi:hypothetical protein
MENTDFDWLNGNWASNIEFSAFNSPQLLNQPAKPRIELINQANMHYHFSD